LNASVGIPEGDRPNRLGQIQWLPNNIKKEQPQRCGSSMLCVLTADETKAVSKKSGRATMYRILLISGYICQAEKCRQKAKQKKEHVVLAK
jgi:hypothetical protein